MGCGGDDAAITIDAGIEDGGPTADVTQNDVVQPDAPTTDSPTGGPVASLTATPVDLGAGDCGGAAITKTVTINNTGGKPLTISATTSGVPFTVTPATTTIAPGASGTFTVGVAIPAASVAGTKLTGTITVTTNDPAKPSITVPVSATPEGATLVFAPASPIAADFGQAKLGQADTPINLTVKNTGNKATTVTFGTPSNAQFSLSSTPASPAAAAPNATIALVTGFTPTTLSPSVATSNITVTGAVCGTSINKVSFSGQGTAGAITGWPTQQLDFGNNPCGGAAPTAKTFTLTNTGTAEVTILTVTIGTKGYAVDLPAGTKIAAGAARIVTVTAPAIPAVSNVPGNYGDTLQITTDVPSDAPHTIPLAEAALGAILAFDTSGTANFGSFGNVPVGQTASQQFKVTNSGNAAATVNTSAPSPFGVSETGFTIGAATGVPTTHDLNATFTPANTQGQVGSLGITATGLCQPLPTNVSLSGTGQNGGVSLSTNSLGFTAECNKTAAPQTFKITNSGNQPMTWTAALGRGATSPYALDVSTATLPAGGESIITVTPAQIPQYPSDVSPSAFGYSILITTDVVNDTGHSVTLSETPVGAVLAFVPSTPLDFGDVPVNTASASQGFTLVNTGNAGSTANVTLTSSNGAFAISGSPVDVAPGTPADVSALFNAPATAGVQDGTIAMSTAGALCAPLPNALQATGTATLAQVVFSPQVLQFDNVNCGATAAPQEIVFSNPGNQDYRVTGTSLLKGAASYFTVTVNSTTGIVPKNNGGTVVITLTPKAIPQTVPSVPDLGTYSDTLSILTDAPNDTAHDVGLNMGAQGVILKPLATKNWDFGSVPVGATGFFNVPLRNDGNVATTVSLTGMQLSPSVFGLNPNPTALPAGSSTTLSGTFTPQSTTQSYADSGSLGVPAATVLCQPLPSYDLTLLGKGSDAPTVTVTGSLAFPPVNCGAQNAAQSVTIHNNGNTPVSYTTDLDFGTYYTVSAGGSGTVAANGGTAVVSVLPKLLTPGASTYSGSAAYGDRLYVTVNGATTNIAISQTARGAELDYNIDRDAGHKVGTNYYCSYYCYYYGYYCCSYSYYSYNYTDSGYTNISNNGNASVTYGPQITPAAGWSTSPMSGTVNASGGSLHTQMDFTPPNVSGSYSTHTLDMTVSGPVCRPLPAQETLYGYSQW
jgi:hypothetical protein